METIRRESVSEDEAKERRVDLTHRWTRFHQTLERLEHSRRRPIAFPRRSVISRESRTQDGAASSDAAAATCGGGGEVEKATTRRCHVCGNGRDVALEKTALTLSIPLCSTANVSATSHSFATAGRAFPAPHLSHLPSHSPRDRLSPTVSPCALYRRAEVGVDGSGLCTKGVRAQLENAVFASLVSDVT